MITSGRRKITGVIFDLDETIISSLSAYTEALNRGIRAFGLEPVGEEVIAGFLDRGFRLGKMLLEMYPAVFQDETNRQVCEDEIHNAYREMEAQEVMLKPGVEGTLQSLKESGYKIGINTGRMTTGENKWRELRRLNIAQFIDAMVTAAEAPAKPAPDGLIKCINELGLSIEDCVFVGDSRIDIMAGKNAGMRTIAIHNGVADKKLLDEQQPDYILADLSLLFPCLTEMQRDSSTAIRGRITEGLKESSFFTQLPWVREQFINKLGIDPYPGTLNLEIVDPEDMARLKEVKKRKGIEIVPGEPGFCPAKCFHVSIGGKVKGALVIPLVRDYPESKLEIISSDKIMDVLDLKVGDFVQVEIL